MLFVAGRQSFDVVPNCVVYASSRHASPAESVAAVGLDGLPPPHTSESSHVPPGQSEDAGVQVSLTGQSVSKRHFVLVVTLHEPSHASPFCEDSALQKPPQTGHGSALVTPSRMIENCCTYTSCSPVTMLR